MSERIQRRRVKGWRMPLNTIYVGRPSKWGNPYSTRDYPALTCLAKYREWLDLRLKEGALSLSELRGKDLACWCPLTDEQGDWVLCHVDVLLELLRESG